MFIKKIRIKSGERGIMVLNGRLHDVLDVGTHWLWHGNKPLEIFVESTASLKVGWSGITHAVRFERQTAEKYWQIIDSPQGMVTIVWHQHLAPQVVPGGESRAFWKPEQGELQTHVVPQHDYRLPDAVQAELLLQHSIEAPLKKHTVNAYERLLVTRRDQLVEILGEGDYIFHLNDENLRCLFADTRQPVYEDSAQIEQWMTRNPALIDEHFHCVDAGTEEIVLWTQHGVLKNFIRPGNRAWLWKTPAVPYQLLRVVLAEDLRIADEHLRLLQAVNYAHHAVFKQMVHEVVVPDKHQGLVYIDQQMQPPLPAGHYHYWRTHRSLESRIADLRLQTSEVSGQELLSADKVTIRANITCNWRITDVSAWFARHSQPQEYLYRELQFAVRAVVGSKTIDGLLADKDAIDAELTRLMRDKNLQGVEIESVGIKDVILPGEIRAILTRVVEAEKNALANNIRRREETAATRSLLNTARVMEENPTALRLKELETLEKVTEKIDKISVFGGLDGVLKGLIHIQPPQGE